MSIDDLDLAKANLEKAKEEHEMATKEILENANEFAKEGSEEDRLVVAAREAQMPKAGAWYRFWETATTIPKDNMYATYTTNERRTWKAIAQSNEDFMKESVNEENLANADWRNSVNRDGVSVMYSPEMSAVHNVRMYKVETTLNGISPKLALLSLVRGPVLGQADDDLIYFREHYNFVGGKTSLVHTVRNVVTSSRVGPRDFFDLTNWSEDEEGRIIFTASSVKAFPKSIPDAVRGVTLLKGFVLTPTENGGTDVVMISQVDPKGWAMKSYINWYVPGKLVQELNAIRSACEKVKADENEERFIRKFVERELDVE